MSRRVSQQQKQEEPEKPQPINRLCSRVLRHRERGQGFPPDPPLQWLQIPTVPLGRLEELL